MFFARERGLSERLQDRKQRRPHSRLRSIRRAKVPQFAFLEDGTAYRALIASWIAAG
jgi:hypothetical protein